MNLFAFAAAMMAVIHLVAGWQRPRLAVIVSGILWLLYAVYERLVATGVLCDANCNIKFVAAIGCPHLTQGLPLFSHSSMFVITAVTSVKPIAFKAAAASVALPPVRH